MLETDKVNKLEQGQLRLRFCVVMCTVRGGNWYVHSH